MKGQVAMMTINEVIESITQKSGLQIKDIRNEKKDRFWVDRETYMAALHYLRLGKDTNVLTKGQSVKVIDQYSVGDGGKVYEYGSCEACNSAVIKPDKFCSECGAKLDWNE